MKVARYEQFGGPDVMNVIIDTPLPVIKKDSEILIKVKKN